MKSNIKKQLWIICIIVVAVILILWLYLSKQSQYGDAEVVEIEHYVSQNGYFSMMDLKCKDFKTTKWKKYCSEHQEKLKDFYKEATWAELEPQIKEKGMILFPCNVLNSQEEAVCKEKMKEL
jgi:hypothetical protein